MSRSLIHLMVRYAVASAAVVMLLSITPSAHAGYPDGLNTYAGYHIMHGGVDPHGNRHRIVIDSDKSADEIYSFAKNGIRLARQNGMVHMAHGLDHWLHGNGSDVWHNSEWYRSGPFLNKLRSGNRFSKQWNKTVKKHEKTLTTGGVAREYWDWLIDYRATGVIPKYEQPYLAGNYTIHGQGIFQCDLSEPDVIKGYVRSIVYDFYNFHKDLHVIIPAKHADIQITDNAMKKLQKSGIGTDYAIFSSWIEEWKCRKSGGSYACEMTWESLENMNASINTPLGPIERPNAAVSSQPPNLPDVFLNGSRVNWGGWHIISHTGKNLGKHKYFVPRGDMRWKLE